MNQITDTVDKNDFSPSVSPDGGAIVFERDGPLFITSAIFVKNLDGSERAIFRAPRPADLPLNLPPAKRGKPDGRTRVIQNGGFSPKWGPAAD
jgi:Tol biopolymer transport system component